MNAYHLPDMDEVARVGTDYYHQELRGGEGHLEVAKLILNVLHSKATMTLSVKPFGCMPSSGVSDGVQSLITERYPDAIFCAVETSGDGAVNFYSRVQMFLFKARQRALAEYGAALEQHGVTEEQVRDYVRGTRYAHPLHRSPHVGAVTGADLVHEVAPFIGKTRLQRAAIHAKRFGKSFAKWRAEDVPRVVHTVREVAPYMPALVRRVALETKDLVPSADELYRKVLSSLVRPTDEEELAIERAESAPAPAVARDAGSLPIMA
ncbi:MAG: hypothetical protein R3B82_10115 [Sandaracinaceae bacterium]